MRELPTIGNSAYSTSALNLSGFSPIDAVDFGAAVVPRRINAGGPFVDAVREHAQLKKEANQMAATTTRRLVQIVIADPDARVPVEKALLFKGEEIFTDMTNEELFYELDIKAILAKYNEFRTTVVDKTVKDRTETLEPVRVRDLKMVVVEIAKF